MRQWRRSAGPGPSDDLIESEGESSSGHQLTFFGLCAILSDASVFQIAPSEQPTKLIIVRDP